MPLRISNSTIAMFLLVVISWCFEMATFGVGGRGQPPGWMAQAFGSGLVSALIASVAWWVQQRRPRSLMPSVIISALISLLMLYGRTRYL